MSKTANATVEPVERVTRSILILRRQRVLLDADLAALYGVTTTRLNQQVRRNLARFPDDFMFQLTAEEHAAWRKPQGSTGLHGAWRHHGRLDLEQ